MRKLPRCSLTACPQQLAVGILVDRRRPVEVRILEIGELRQQVAPIMVERDHQLVVARGEPIEQHAARIVVIAVGVPDREQRRDRLDGRMPGAGEEGRRRRRDTRCRSSRSARPTSPARRSSRRSRGSRRAPSASGSCRARRSSRRCRARRRRRPHSRAARTCRGSARRSGSARCWRPASTRNAGSRE